MIWMSCWPVNNDCHLLTNNRLFKFKQMMVPLIERVKRIFWSYWSEHLFPLLSMYFVYVIQHELTTGPRACVILKCCLG